MHAKRRAAVVLACVLGLPGTALAGPSWWSWEDIYFPLTRWAWAENVRGPGRSVRLTPVEDERSVHWRVEVRSRAGSELSETEGELALASAPRECDRLELHILNREVSRNGSGFIRLHQTRQLDRVQGLKEADVFVKRFQELAKYPREIPPRWNCEAIRERCAGKNARVFEPAAREISPGVYESSPGAAASISCKQIDRSIAACQQLEARDAARARVVAVVPPGPSCKGLVVAARAEEGKSIELRAIGQDGADWGRVKVEPGGLPIRLRVLVLTPLTVPADVVLLVPLTLITLPFLLAGP